MTETETGPELLAQAADLHSRILTLDGHLDIPSALTDAAVESPTQFDLVKARRGLLSGAVLTVHAPSGRIDDAYLARGRQELEKCYERIVAITTGHPDLASLANSPASFLSIAEAGRFAVVLGFQNASPLGSDLGALERWIDRGIQLAALTHIGNNDWADSARPFPFIGGTRHAGGLTAAGRQAIRLFNRRGVVVDVAQLSSAALRDVLEVSDAPVVDSHTAVRSIVDGERNLTDAELGALRDHEGLVNIVGFSGYLVPRSDKALLTALSAHWQRYGLDVPERYRDFMTVNDPATADWPSDKFWTFRHEYHEILDALSTRASTRDLGNAVEYATERIGVEHVGLASDFNHGGGLTDWADTGQALNVTAELLRRGYTEGDLRAIWAGNFLRVWQAAVDRRQR